MHGHRIRNPPARGVRPRDGFSLSEILVALAIVSCLAAVSFPTVYAFIGGAESLKILKSMQAVRKGINAFKADTHMYPLSLGQLITPPAEGDMNLCGEPILESRFHLWHGPYLQVTELPLIYGDDTVKTDLSRRDAGAGDDQGYLRITVENVDSASALQLEELQGDDGDLKSGILQWKRIKGQGYAPRLFYDLPIRGC